MKVDLMCRCLVLTLLAALSACSTYKPPPGWPDGPERPINAQPIQKPAVD